MSQPALKTQEWDYVQLIQPSATVNNITVAKGVQIQQKSGQKKETLKHEHVIACNTKKCQAQSTTEVLGRLQLLIIISKV